MNTTRRGFLGLLTGAGVACAGAKAGGMSAVLHGRETVVRSDGDPLGDGPVDTTFRKLASTAASEMLRQLRAFKGERIVCPRGTGYSVATADVDVLTVALSEWQESVVMFDSMDEFLDQKKSRPMATGVGAIMGQQIASTLVGATHLASMTPFPAADVSDFGMRQRQTTITAGDVAVRVCMWPEYQRLRFAMDCLWGFLPNVAIDDEGLIS